MTSWDEARGDPAPRDSHDEPADGAGAGAGAGEEEGGGGAATDTGTRSSSVARFMTVFSKIHCTILIFNLTLRVWCQVWCLFGCVLRQLAVPKWAKIIFTPNSPHLTLKSIGPIFASLIMIRHERRNNCRYSGRGWRLH